MNARNLVFLNLALLLTVGCKSIGPKTVTRDRFDYSGALAESWKNQMLLNLVKTRYLDLPIYLDVGQIVSGYTLETGVTISGQASPQSMRGDTFGGLGVSGKFTDRPTITYSPLTGEKFLEGFLAPINPAKVFSLVQSGYPADFVLELTVDSLNGLHNRPVSLGSNRQADPEFFRVLALMREIQDAGAIGLRVEEATNDHRAAVLFFRGDRVEPEMSAKIVEARRLLGISESPSGFRLVRSPLRGGPGELGVDTRSLVQVMGALAWGVEIPPKHQQRKLTPPLPVPVSEENLLLRIHGGSDKPADAFVEVRYEGEWFWIANDDWESKRTFSSILFLFTLADAGEAQRLPTITIPAQ